MVGTYRGYPLVAGFSGGEVVHLGVNLFGAEYKAASNTLLCDFAERYLLELLAEEDEQTRMRRMYDDGVALTGDLRRIPQLEREPLRFGITFVAGRIYRLEWHDGQTLVFSLSVPAQYELIRGLNKIELEGSFSRDVLRFRMPEDVPAPGADVTPDVTPDVTSDTTPDVMPDVPFDVTPDTTPDAGPAEQPVRLDEDLYVLRKGYYLLEQMTCEAYYTRSGERFEPVCDSLHPVESLHNLLSVGGMKSGYTLDVTLRKYGFRTEEFSCPLGRMVDFCLAQGCTPYVGIESEQQGTITAVLIMVNAEYGYNHVFKIVFDTHLLARREGRIAVTLNAYTPTHNLENLYDEERQTRHRGAPKIKL